MGNAIGPDPAPIHALGVERRCRFSICREHDRPAVAAHLRNRVVDHALARLFRRLTEVAHARADLMGCRGTDVVLAPTGTRYRTTRIGPGAVSYTHLRAHETPEHLVCRLL